MSYAMQQMKNEASLRSIAKPLTDLWNKSIAVASISRLVAKRTQLSADEAFLTGLLHGIGSLYIMAPRRDPERCAGQRAFLDGVGGRLAGIHRQGRAGELGLRRGKCATPVGEQGDTGRRWKHAAGLADVLIASLLLAEALKMPPPRTVATEGINEYLTVGLSAEDCAAILAEAQDQIQLVHQALA